MKELQEFNEIWDRKVAFPSCMVDFSRPYKFKQILTNPHKSPQIPTKLLELKGDSL